MILSAVAYASHDAQVPVSVQELLRAPELAIWSCISTNWRAKPLICVNGSHSDKERGKSLHRCMPSDMAMHQPDTWIVSLESKDNVTGGWKERSISSRRVGQVQYDGAIITSETLSQDVEIVTCYMLEKV
jgi:hypothetical protein